MGSQSSKLNFAVSLFPGAEGRALSSFRRLLQLLLTAEECLRYRKARGG